MRNLRVILTGLILTLGMAGTATADTSTFNRYSTTNQYGGYTETTVHGRLNSTSVQTTVENSTKIESVSDLGDTNISNVNVSGTIGGDINFKANAHSSNNRPEDPVATVYVSDIESTTLTRTHENLNIKSFSSNKFSGRVFEHEVGTRNN